MSKQKKKSNYEYSIRPLSDLTPYAQNARTHSDKQIKQIEASIKKFGFTNPVLIDDKGGIIAGHGRVLAAVNLSIADVPCITLTGLTKAQKRAYVIADNQLALNSGWDIDLLSTELNFLVDNKFDIDVIGFGEGFMSGIFLDRLNGGTDANGEWEGMPEFDQTDAKPFRQVIVSFENNEDVEAFFKLLNASHTKKTKSLWFPDQPNRELKNLSYE